MEKQIALQKVQRVKIKNLPPSFSKVHKTYLIIKNLSNPNVTIRLEQVNRLINLGSFFHLMGKETLTSIDLMAMRTGKRT